MHRRGTPLETVQDSHDEGDGVSPPLNDNLPSASYGTPSPTSPTLNGTRSNSLPSSGTGAPPPPYLDTYYRSSKNPFSTPSPTIASSPRSPNFELTPPRARTASGTQAGPLRVSSPLSATATPPPLSPKLTLNSLSGRSYYTGRNGGALRENGYYPEPPATASPLRTSFGFQSIPESGEPGSEGPSVVPGRATHLRHARSQSGMPYVGTNGLGPSTMTSSISMPIPRPTGLPPSNSLDVVTNGRPSSNPRSPGIMPLSPYLPLEGDPVTSPLPLSSSSGTSSSSYRDNVGGHDRIHSRNLSVFFPRPGGASTSVEAPPTSDDGQEIEYGNNPEGVLIPPSNGTALGANFRFGSKNPYPTPLSPLGPNGETMSGASRPTRRGHHHKHSVSHNFFSFMDPTAITHVQTPSATNGSFPQHVHHTAMSVSTSLGSQALPTPSTTHFSSASMQHRFVEPTPSSAGGLESRRNEGRVPTGSKTVRAQAFAALQFALGAWVWVEGQRQGSLACTGLGYWVVFDAVGVWVGEFGERMRMEPRSPRRSYGSRRVETVALFAQAIYLLFASVYVCKEAFEHVLLASEGGEDAGDAHHHHSPAEAHPDFQGLQYPTSLVWTVVCTLLVSGFFFGNHDRLVEATGNHIPTPLSIIKTLTAIGGPRSSAPTKEKPSSAVLRLVSNPFSVLPSFFAGCILMFAALLDPSLHHSADVILACAITVFTFMVAYPAAVALGKVLLQTAPSRGLPGGQMEAFLRVMRELEGHPHIVHLPAPHLWQLTPVPSDAKATRPSESSYRSSEHDELTSEEGSLVATVQLHVRRDLDDAGVLKLTSDVWERSLFKSFL
ncbi:hypothetical protein FS837_001187 [Tulasnella sp. UAMH 9824]|nr:hypothetical protein FS837_001187 [Tulasnella sp. UAMH 9824]